LVLKTAALTLSGKLQKKTTGQDFTEASIIINHAFFLLILEKR